MNEHDKRVAAIMAVLSKLGTSDDHRSQIGRQPGKAWSQDHRRLVSGRPGLMLSKSGRSPWR